MSEFSYHGSDGCLIHVTTVGDGDPLVLLHGGGPDHESLIPLANLLADRYTVILPDIRGYGRSVCTDPIRHTWAQYTDDVIELLDTLDAPRALLGGTGLGSTVTLRTSLAHPERVKSAVLISVENIEDDEDVEAATAFLDAFAERVLTEGLEAAWTPILELFPPVIASMVREAIPRANPQSIAAAAAIGRDRAFGSVEDLEGVTVPTLIIPGTDSRHPTVLGETLARVLPGGQLSQTTVSSDLHNADDLANAVAPAIREFFDGRT